MLIMVNVAKTLKLAKRMMKIVKFGTRNSQLKINYN